MILRLHVGGQGGEAPQIRDDHGHFPGLAPHLQGTFVFQESFHHFLGDIAPEGVPDEIPFFDVVGKLLAQFIEGSGQGHHLPDALLRHRHREIPFPHLMHRRIQTSQRPGNGPGEPRPPRTARRARTIPASDYRS